MKVFICYYIKDTPHGGANQFLKALRDKFAERGMYSENPAHCDVVLFNSHHYGNELAQLKNRFNNKVFAHRVDGPMRLYNDMSDQRDFIVHQLNGMANATIFQSQWSQAKSVELGFQCKAPTAVICNAPDPNIFNSEYQKKTNDKITLIATSWSDNMRKGFRYYKFLDNNLDFSKYEFLFAGRSPVEFENIKMLGALSSKELAKHIKSSDVFITASENDPCSNSLIEALSCGVPAIALDSGGHPEIIKDGGCLFQNYEDLMKIMEEIPYNISSYKKNIEVDHIDDVVEKYTNFFKQLLR